MTQLTVHEKSSCKDAKFFDTMKKVLPRIHINRKKCIFAGSLCDLLLKDFAYRILIFSFDTAKIANNQLDKRGKVVPSCHRCRQK